MSFPNGSFPPNSNNNNQNNHEVKKSQNSISNSGRYNDKNRDTAEPVAIINTFAQVISHKFSSSPTSPTADSTLDNYDNNHHHNQTSRNLSRLDELYKTPAYEAEKKILRDINSNGMANGVLAGLCTFAALRASPHLIRRFARRYHHHHQPGNNQMGMGSGGYKLDALSSTTGQPPKPRFILRAVKLAVDALASVTVAMFASAQFADRTKLLQDLADIPLVEGRSLISEELCDDFVDVYRSIPKRTWDRHEGTVDTLDAIGKFVRNCMRRRVVEEEVRRERGSGGINNGDGGVEIPSPGVPRDLEVNIVWGDRSRDVAVGRERENGGGEEFSFDYGDGSGGDGDFRYDLPENENNFGDELEGIRDERGWNLEPTMDTSGNDKKTFGNSRGNRSIGK